MKAVVYTQYGSPDVLHLQDVEKPTPKDNEVLVKIRAVSANAADWRLMRGKPFLVRMETGFRKPKNRILGSDIAGQVEAVGKEVTLFRPADEVIGDLSGCGLGGFAEYVCIPEKMLAPKSPAMTYEQAAALPMAAVTALQGLRDKGNVQPGQTVLINGASGGVGTFAVQIAKSFGAEVTAVCSTAKIDMVRALGADHVIDYTKEDFTRSGRRYDLVVAANGYTPISAYKRLLNPNGTYVMVGGSMKQIFEAMLLGPIHSLMGGKKLTNLMAAPKPEDLVFMNTLVESGKVTPVIEKCYSGLQHVPDALRQIEAGHARGKIIITVA